MKYVELEKLLCAANIEGRKMDGFVTFSNESYTKEYTWESRTYLISSDNKRFQEGKISNSIWASSVDGSDVGLKLSNYMFGLYAWVIEDCGVVDYLLVSTANRKTVSKVVFTTKEQADAAMRKEVSDCIGMDMDADELDGWLEDTPETKAGMVKYTCAYLNDVDGCDHNWEIFTLFHNGCETRVM